MRDTYLPFSIPAVGKHESDAVVEAIRSGWLTTGPRVKALERDFGEFISAPGALALNSCTAGLHTALLTLGIGPGDEVITTPMTFAASVNVIEHVGARPVLADIEADTLNIDPRAVDKAITRHTRALIPVHFAGHPADLDPLWKLAELHSLHVIEDAAHAFPAAYEGRAIGSGMNPVAFSFYATKNLTTGEGGMLTGDPELLDEARVISLHGLSRDAWDRHDQGACSSYEVSRPGFKYNMTDIQAAMGLVQLGKIPAMQKRRAHIVQAYHDAFKMHDALEVPTERPNVDHAWHLYVLRLRTDALTIDRDRFIEEMSARNIGTSVHFTPVHLHPYYRDRYNFKPQDFPIAFDNYRRMLSIPLTPSLSDEDVQDVIDAVLDICERFRR